jgi:hypothetical protein
MSSISQVPGALGSSLLAPARNLRERLRPDSAGCFAFESSKPVSYPISGEGPMGKLALLDAIHSDPSRAAQRGRSEQRSRATQPNSAGKSPSCWTPVMVN